MYRTTRSRLIRAAVAASAGVLLTTGPVSAVGTLGAAGTMNAAGTGGGAGMLGSPASAAGGSQRERALERQLDDMRESLEGTSKALVDAAVDLRRAQAQLVGANAELAATRAALAAARKRDDVLAERLAVAEAAVEKAGRDLAARRVQEADTRRRLGRIAREAYLTSGLSGLSIALNAASPEQFANRVNVAGTALRQQNGAIARLDVQQAETRARRVRMEAAQDQVAQLKRESAALVVQRQKAERASASAAAQVEKLVALEARSVQTIAARKSAERRRIARLEAEQDRLSRLLRARAARSARQSSRGAGSGGGSGGGNGSGRLSYPVQAPVTSGFGWRFHPVLRYSRLHAGTDFGAACGTPVRASAPGTVVRSGSAGGYGNQVVVDHGRIGGKSLATSYNHLSRIVVHSGTVRRGQLIAYSGTTGLSTGCHLHYEVYENGTHVNPMKWL